MGSDTLTCPRDKNARCPNISMTHASELPATDCILPVPPGVKGKPAPASGRFLQFVESKDWCVHSDRQRERHLHVWDQRHPNYPILEFPVLLGRRGRSAIRESRAELPYGPPSTGTERRQATQDWRGPYWRHRSPRWRYWRYLPVLRSP